MAEALTGINEDSEDHDALRTANILQTGVFVANKVKFLLKIPIVSRAVRIAIDQVVTELSKKKLAYDDVPEVARLAWAELVKAGVIPAEESPEEKEESY